MESLANSMMEFNYEPDSGLLFDSWYNRYRHIFEREASPLDDAGKVGLLWRKMSNHIHKRFTNIVLPRQPHELSLEDTLKHLSKLFGRTESQVSQRCKCLQILKMENEDFKEYASRVNLQCELFKLDELNADQFKCLIFILGLKSSDDGEIRIRLLRHLNDSNEMVKLEKLVDEKQNGFCKASHDSNSTTNKTKHQNSNSSNNNKTRFSAKSVFAVNQVQFKKLRKYVTVSMNAKQVKLQVDTASDITIISISTWKFIEEPEAFTTTDTANDANANKIKLLATFSTEVTIGEISKIVDCYISNTENLDILGIDWIEKFNLKCLTTAHWASNFQNAKEVFIPKRPVPYAARSEIEMELQRLENAGIITPVDTSKWAAPIVVSKRNRKVRICGDYSTGLNNAIELNQYPLPTPEDILSECRNCSIFTHLDLSDAYLQAEIDDESKELLTVNTHKGLFKFNRLTPGVKCAPGAFQRIMDQVCA
ncbi:uncharacterized protein K02A2.6-like [Stomoxys calcitrans]|uniref:uncharacterized protein K02A2.6-like n=1 Tax=Stomoxys calcitrans TaxID=35570 RepID=UPI0027E2506A|nr:uncharacterized protein K02A2.6-like [Stomoxys calcitrans]